MISRLIWATLNENESAYLRRLSDALGSTLNINPLLEQISDTVDNFTFRPFTSEISKQISTTEMDKSLTAKNMYEHGWEKLEKYFGGKTKTGSWYSWKTRPGRMLIELMAKKDDALMNENNENIWPAKEGACKLCDSQSSSLHHCRRCGIVFCGNCGTKKRHIQPANSILPSIWQGEKWACISCAAIIDVRQKSRLPFL